MKKCLYLTLATILLSCASCSNTTKEYDVDDYRTTMKFYDGFKVMQLTDLHLGLQGDLVRNLNFVEKLIDDGDPDLIVITGDSFMYASKGIVDTLMESLNNKCKELTNSHPERLVKFAITFGNHDNQGDYHRYYVNEAVLKYATNDGDEIKDHKYAAFIDYEDDNLSGLTNYYIDIVDDQSKSKEEVDVKYRLHVIDSNSYHYIGPGYKYEIIKDKLDELNALYELGGRKEKNESIVKKPENKKITLNDIAGLDTAKEIIKQLIIYPFKYPEIYRTFNKSSSTYNYFYYHSHWNYIYS